jgi:hypothetical protein
MAFKNPGSGIKKVFAPLFFKKRPLSFSSSGWLARRAQTH